MAFRYSADAMSAKPKRGGSNGDLFPDLLTADEVEKLVTLRPLKHPVWSHQKARLIEKYLYFFVMVTRHGTYIDGFAGPQSPEHLDTWSAKRVIESRPRYLRHFFLCDLDAQKIEALRVLWNEQVAPTKKESKRDCQFFQGDFNLTVDTVLASGVIDEKQAAFALLDQRTFECHWSTVEKLARHKKNGNKIELFYFLAVKWLHRSLAGIEANEQKVEAWWGNGDWKSLSKLTQLQIRDVVTKRIKEELGYKSATPYPIYEKEDGEGSVMYYMIHASDHPAAPGLMWRAYDQAIASLDVPEQGLLFEKAEVIH
jgi:three-Cys-motif partner protein